MIEVLVAPGPEADYLLQLCGSKPNSAFCFKDDLRATSRWRWCGNLSVSWSLAVGAARCKLENDGCARRLRRNQTQSEEIEKGELVFLRSLIQPLDDSVEITCENPGYRRAGALVRQMPFGNVTQASCQQLFDHLFGVAVIELNCRSGDHRASPSCR